VKRPRSLPSRILMMDTQNHRGEVRFCVPDAYCKCSVCSATMKTEQDYRLHQCDPIVTRNLNPTLRGDY